MGYIDLVAQIRRWRHEANELRRQSVDTYIAERLIAEGWVQATMPPDNRNKEERSQR